MILQYKILVYWLILLHLQIPEKVQKWLMVKQNAFFQCW